jgi:hypothetical protein
MRRVVALLATAHLLLAAGPAWPHGDARELGHHWSVAEYRNEMWFQILVISVAVGLYVIGIFAARAWKRWSIYRQ